MTSARSSGALAGQLGSLYHLGAAGTLTDSQLLDRFLTRDDPAASEAAFTALVDRHGAMVLTVCQKVLGDAHDAHDAFQATFLVLVNKADSIRKRESVAGWLLGIARRVAARARVEGARRRRHLHQLGAERAIVEDAPGGPSPAEPEPDYAPLIAEVDRLPERFRAPVVLHYFEGLSTEATAQRLGCARGTVLSRLARRRSRIKARLEQQGVSFAGLIPAGEALTRWIPSPPVPAGLAQTTIKAAGSLALAGAVIESVVPAAVASLSRGVARTLVLTKVRAAAALLLMAVAGVSIGLAATFKPTDEPRQTAARPAMPQPQRGNLAKHETAQPEGKTEGERFEYAGRVVAPDGKPVNGAKLHLAYSGYQEQGATIRATSDAEGRFQFAMTKADFSAEVLDEPWFLAQVVANAPGFGVGWTNAFNDKRVRVDPRNLTIRLARDDVPIEGRIVDLEGRPISGVTVRPIRILEPEHGGLSAWIAASKSGQEGSNATERAYLTRTLFSDRSGLPGSITTDSDGRFSIRGIGRERVIELNLSGPMVQAKEISILTRESAPFQVTYGRRSPNWGITLYYGAHFTHAAAPTKPVVGVVTDKDTGKPLAGVRIDGKKTAETPLHGFNGIEAKTDNDGRYRLTGLPKGRGNQVIAIPAKGQPYLASWMAISDTPGLDPVVLDVGLKRGIVIEGRVTDKETGKPLKAFVEYNSFQDNPHLAEAPGFQGARVWGQYQTEPDGSYRVVGLPGRGMVSAIFLGGSSQYLTGIGLKGSPRVVPNLDQEGFNSLVEIDPPKDATTIHCDLALERGLARTLRVVDPQGRPVAGARIQGHIRYVNWSQPQEAAEFRIEGLRRDEKRRVHAVLAAQRLAGWVELRADEPGIAELKLQPWATAVGRLVDADGEPRGHVALVPRPRYEHNFETDSQGRFCIEGLIPGMPIEIWVSPQTGFLSGKIAKGLVLAAGETKDLGDVKEAR